MEMLNSAEVAARLNRYGSLAKPANADHRMTPPIERVRSQLAACDSDPSRVSLMELVHERCELAYRDGVKRPLIELDDSELDAIEEHRKKSALLGLRRNDSLYHYVQQHVSFEQGQRRRAFEERVQRQQDRIEYVRRAAQRIDHALSDLEHALSITPENLPDNQEPVPTLDAKGAEGMDVDKLKELALKCGDRADDYDSRVYNLDMEAAALGKLKGASATKGAAILHELAEASRHIAGEYRECAAVALAEVKRRHELERVWSGEEVLAAQARIAELEGDPDRLLAERAD